MVAQAAPRTVPYEVYQREHRLRMQAEEDLDKAKHDLQSYKNEFFLQRDIRRAPVLRPIAKDILEECLHTEKWGTVKAPDGSTRANFTTIADRLKCDPGTVKREAERLEKLGLIDIHEHQGPKDERDRKYIAVKHEQIATIGKLTDPDKVVPEQGGDRYFCTKCDSRNVAIRKVTTTTVLCLDCQHESTLDPVDTGWTDKFGHKMQKAQKQLAFKKSKHAQEPEPLPEKQLAEQCVYTVSHAAEDPPPEPENFQKQVAFTTSASHTRSDIVTELHALPIWACHRDKVPYNAKSARSPQKAKSNDSATWTGYEQAKAIYEESQSWKYPYDGIGCFNNGDYTFTDLDHCIEDDTISDQAQTCIDAINSYAERSQSGTGVHVIARATLPKDVKRPGIEMYNHHRFFVWTGQHLAGTPETIEDRQAAMNADPAYIARLYPKKDGSPDWSRADCALCEKLIYYGAGGDVSTIDGIFRTSGLMREKWNRADYRERTINRALGLQQRRTS